MKFSLSERSDQIDFLHALESVSSSFYLGGISFSASNKFFYILYEYQIENIDSFADMKRKFTQ